MDAAQALILETGYAATAVDAVIGTAGITKGAFFYHFKTKADLAKALVLRDAERDAAHLEQNLARAESLSNDPLQQLLLCLGLFEEELAKLEAPYPGCLYASFVYEAELFDAQTMAVVHEVFANWTRRISAKLEQIIALYPPRLPIDLRTLAEMSLTQAEGAYILGKVNKDARAPAAQFRHYRNYLELLFSPQIAGSAKAVKRRELDAAPADA
jgi:TetR/AcrR family transcriptional repressor of nem operon